LNREERRREARRNRQAVSNAGNLWDRNAAVIDTRGAVLADSWNTVVVHTESAGDIVGIEIGGRVNKSSARSSTLYLVDVEGAARLAADLVTLAARQGATDPAWADAFQQALDEQLAAGTSKP
jgi:hypothetical protein